MRTNPKDSDGKGSWRFLLHKCHFELTGTGMSGTRLTDYGQGDKI